MRAAAGPRRPHPRIGAVGRTMDGRTDIRRRRLSVLDSGRRGRSALNSAAFHKRVYFRRIGDNQSANRDGGGGETMGPVPFNRTRVKQEDRAGKRRK